MKQKKHFPRSGIHEPRYESSVERNAKRGPKSGRGQSPPDPLISNSYPPKPRGSRIRNFKIWLPVSEQLLFLNLPAVRRHTAWRERVVMVKMAIRLMEYYGDSQNRAANIFGVSASGLSKWLRRYREGGEDALLECAEITRQAASQGVGAVPCKLSFIKQE